MYDVVCYDTCVDVEEDLVLIWYLMIVGNLKPYRKINCFVTAFLALKKYF